MIRYQEHPVTLQNGKTAPRRKGGRRRSRKDIAYSILKAHNHRATGKAPPALRRADFARHHLCGHHPDGARQRLTEFPVPYAMTNCHNSLCAVGGTINEDDHVFGLSAAKKYGGIYVPPSERHP
jgi:aconitate hydratase